MTTEPENAAPLEPERRAEQEDAARPAETVEVERLVIGEGATEGQVRAVEAASAHAEADRASAGPRTGARVPASDVARDVVAAVLLVASLGLPWTLTAAGTDRVEAVLTVLLALVTLTVPYLARGGVLPQGWTVQRTRTARLVGAIPLAVVVVVYLVLDVVTGTAVQPRGAGTGLALALAGAVLVAVPRSTELGPEEVDPGPARWSDRALVVLAGVQVVGALAALVLFLLSDRWSGATGLVLAILSTVLVLVLAVVPVAGAARGDAAWRRVLLGLGASAAVLFMLASSSHHLLRAESMHTLRWGTLLVPAAGAVVAGAPLARRLAGQRTGAVRAVVLRLLGLLAVSAGVLAVARVVALLGGGRGPAVVTTLVAAAVIAVLAVLAAVRVRASGVGGRLLTVVAAVATLVLGTVAVAVTVSEGGGVAIELAVVVYVLPVLLLAAVAAPALAGGVHDLEPDDAAAVPEAAYVWSEPSGGSRRRGAVAAANADAWAEPERRERPAGPVPTRDAGREASAPVVTAGHRRASDRAEAVDPSSGAAADDHALYRRPAEATTADVSDEQAAASGRDEAPAERTSVLGVGVASPAGAAGSAASTGATSTVEERSQVQDAGSTAVLPPVRFTAEQASDPSTPLEVLAQIAEHEPSLRPQLALNPSTYPALLDWLGALGDPDIDAALARRGR